MSALYAVLALVVMVLLYFGLGLFGPERAGLASLVRGAIFQVGRGLQVFLQKSSQRGGEERWRPAVVCISSATFERRTAFELLRWLSARYGFGTYIHYIEGYLSSSTALEARATLERLVRLADISDSRIYVDTMVSPSFTTAIAQAAQLPGVSGKDNNTVLLEFSRHRPDDLEHAISNHQLLCASGFDVCILASHERDFGYRREIHVWLTANDLGNANLMILIAYVLLGHRDWHGAQIKLFAIYPEHSLREERDRLIALVREGRIPISPTNVEVLAQREEVSKRSIVNQHSRDADLVIVGFLPQLLHHRGSTLFEGYDDVGTMLFVNANRDVELDERKQEDEPAPEEEPSSDEPVKGLPPSDEVEPENAAQ